MLLCVLLPLHGTRISAIVDRWCGGLQVISGFYRLTNLWTSLLPQPLLEGTRGSLLIQALLNPIPIMEAALDCVTAQCMHSYDIAYWCVYMICDLSLFHLEFNVVKQD